MVIAIPLEAGYLLHGPRLLYLGSIGLAVLWPVLLEPIYGHGPFWPAPLGGRVGLHSIDRLGLRPRSPGCLPAIDRPGGRRGCGDGRPEEEGILLVNLPSWLDTPANTYPVGVEFVAMMGNYLFVEELMAENLGVDRPVQAIKVPDLLARQEYNYGIHEQSRGDTIDGGWAPAGSHVFIVTFGQSGLETRYTGRLVPMTDAASPLASFGTYQLLKSEAENCGNTVTLITTWRNAPAAGDDESASLTTSVFAQLLDGDGQLMAQADGPLLGLRPDLLDLSEEWLMVDKREFPAPSVGAEEILIGVYDFASGQRYPASDQTGEPLSDDALRLIPVDCS